jgi:hypothetical protein
MNLPVKVLHLRLLKHLNLIPKPCVQNKDGPRLPPHLDTHLVPQYHELPRTLPLSATHHPVMVDLR